MKIVVHPTAIVHPRAQLSEGVQVGPYSIVGENVSIGKETKISPGVLLEWWIKIGSKCVIQKGVVIGTPAQDIRYKGERSFVEIGDGNTIREYTTIHRGTEKDSVTRIGNNNFIMAYSHIAHNCQVGDGVVIANLGTLAGYVRVEDKVIISGLSAVHQFVRIGTYSIVGACSKVIKDIPPYTKAYGNPTALWGLNTVGLRRANLPLPIRNSLKKAYKTLFRSNLNTQQALERIKNELKGISEVDYLCNFIQSSKRGICKEKSSGPS